MANKEDKGLSIPETVKQAVESVAKVLGIAAVELWGIFVRQYFVKGLTEAFTAISLGVGAYLLHNSLGWWALVPAGLAHIFAYGAIMLLGNPKYYAIEDISKKIQEFRNEEKERVSRRYY